MPKRIVDGEGLWTSKKIRRVPFEYRTHYANWIPLAGVNGTFEIDFGAIRAKVYASSLDPDMTDTEVFYIIREFISAQMIRVWEDRGKIWGYFVGIEKGGRLPGDSILKKYNPAPPEPPTDDPPFEDQMNLLSSLLPKDFEPIPMPPKEFLNFR